MKKLFLDSNLWLRFFLKDNEEQYSTVNKLLSFAEESVFRPYTSSLVFLEINFVLARIYHLSIKKILEYFKAIQQLRNITILESTDLAKALNYYKKYQIKFSDCLIASQVGKGKVLISFDKELKKILEIKTLEPKDFITQLKLPKSVN